ncbi:uncharacterized protein ACO6RY_16556 [Pungitius sinensis]
MKGVTDGGSTHITRIRHQASPQTSHVIFGFSRMKAAAVVFLWSLTVGAAHGATGTRTDGGTGTRMDGGTGTRTDGATGTRMDGGTGTRMDGADKVNTRRCSNLTLVLDNWKYAIMTQVRDLLLHDHSTVLPDYARIEPLSDALGELYKDFNGLKELLSQFTARFDRVEGFADSVRYGRNPPPPRGRPGEAEPAGGRPPGKRTRVVVRRVKKPAAPEK